MKRPTKVNFSLFLIELDDGQEACVVESDKALDINLAGHLGRTMFAHVVRTLLEDHGIDSDIVRSRMRDLADAVVDDEVETLKSGATAASEVN